MNDETKPKYFRCQMIPGCPSSMLYWLAYCGVDENVAPENIPDGAIVTDVTSGNHKKLFRKRGYEFVIHLNGSEYWGEDLLP